MRHALLLLFCLCAWITPAHARSDNPVLMHPGETFYARFERKGTTLKLVSAGKEKDDQAQVILHLGLWDKAAFLINFKIENKFDRELNYKVEAKVSSMNMHRSPPVSPVVEGKVSFESWPVPVSELIVSGFSLSK